MGAVAAGCAPLRFAGPTPGNAPAPDLVSLSLRGVPPGEYSLRIVHESGAMLTEPGCASGEFTLHLPPGPCTLHLLRADGSEFAQRVFRVGEANPQAIECDLRVR